MFVFSEVQPDYRWPVTVFQPSQIKPGEAESNSFIAVFRPDPTADLVAISHDEAHARAFLEQVFVGFFEITDQDGEPLPNSAETRSALLGLSEVRQALFVAYCESRAPRARQQAMEKN